MESPFQTTFPVSSEVSQALVEIANELAKQKLPEEPKIESASKQPKIVQSKLP
jgi:hypothetical protein